MKITSLLLTIALAGLAHAGEKLPRGTFGFKDLEKAKTEATAKNKPIAFVFSDKDTTCPICQDATSNLIGTVKSKAVVVFINAPETNAGSNEIPEVARKALMQGTVMPKIAVTDSGVTKLIAATNYETYSKDEKAMREFKKALKPAK
jgi:hypothetical protein